MVGFAVQGWRGTFDSVEFSRFAPKMALGVAFALYFFQKTRNKS
jgi:hypothetical protein